LLSRRVAGGALLGALAERATMDGDWKKRSGVYPTRHAEPLSLVALGMPTCPRVVERAPILAVVLKAVQRRTRAA
jgi:hypothetical protein